MDNDDPWGRPRLTIVVDGERFLVRPSPAGGYNDGWTTGPNDGYGFSSSRRHFAGDDPDAVAAAGAGAAERASPAPVSIDEHRRQIRDVLDDIDPRTGYTFD